MITAPPAGALLTDAIDHLSAALGEILEAFELLGARRPVGQGAREAGRPEDSDLSSSVLPDGGAAQRDPQPRIVSGGHFAGGHTTGAVGARFAGEPVCAAVMLYAVGAEVIEIGVDGHQAARALVGVGDLHTQGWVGAH